MIPFYFSPGIRDSRHERAFTVVEIAIAIGVASFALLAIVALLPVGISSIRDSAEEIAALSLAQSIIADLRSSVDDGVSESFRYKVAIPKPGDQVTQIQLYLTEGGILKAGPAEARYRLSIRLVPPPTKSRGPTTAHLRATWPPQADPDAATTQATEMVAAFTSR
jgi:type II secretory pathway pseudopilin PulG